MNKINVSELSDDQLAEELAKANVVRDDVVALCRALTGEQRNRAARAQLQDALSRMTPEAREAAKAAL